jgi:prolyl oligopeptidase
MKPKFYFVLSIAAVLLAVTGCEREPRGYQYPETRQVDVVETLHGTEVADPYRWLEALDDDEVRAWIEAQNRVTRGHFESIEGRSRLEERLTALWNYERYATPWHEAGRYYYFHNDGLQNHSVLYTLESLDDEPEVLIDPNEFSEDGTVALTMVSISDDGRYLAYGKAVGGSDWQTFHIREIETGEEYDYHLEWIKYSPAAWTHDHAGFFYSRFPVPEGDPLTAPNVDHQLYYHELGKDQDEDVLIYARPDRPDWRFAGQVTRDGRYLIISVHEGTDRRNRVYYMDLEDPASPVFGNDVVELLDDFDGGYQFLDNDGPVFYFLTTAEAPRGRIIAVDTRNPEREEWVTVVPEKERVIRGVEPAGNAFAIGYLEDAHSRIELVRRDGEAIRDIELPTLGSVGAVRGSPARTEMFFSFSSFLYPTTIFRYDLEEGGEPQIFRQPEIAGFDPENYVTRQVFYESRDGTAIPMFITHRRGIERDGSNPTLLFGYGGFSISMLPSFSVENLAWIEQGGIYASANIRGGGEYGREWHQAGVQEKKQNVFDDFIAAGEYLVAENYTSPRHLGIYGRSNGGLLVGAVLNQRPDLFGAAIPAVGVMDMLRFHKFTVGAGWTPDYGNPDEPEHFENLYAYSPYHNVRASHDYPPTLVTTADHDDRVVPGHSFKYIAMLQHRQAGANPMLIRIETRAGHGAGMPTGMRIEEARDRLGFLAHHLGLEID